MVFIFTRIADATTVEVIQWLINLKKEFFRFNTINAISGTSFVYGSMPPLPELKQVNSRWPEHITSFYFNGANVLVAPGVSKADELDSQVITYLKSEADTLLEFELSKFDCETQFGLSPFAPNRINKLRVLDLAKTIGLKVPKSSIVTNKRALWELKRRWGRIINKSIGEGVNLETETFLVSGQRTEEITESVIQGFNDTFFPSLFQELIEKKYELRVFYFRGDFYSIAIFTQNADTSRIDSRNIDYQKPSRQVPYILPENIREKIRDLMDKLGLNYGSIDLIYGVDNQYYFLEVNPYGQYGFLSTAGNFYLERKIAEYLQ